MLLLAIAVAFAEDPSEAAERQIIRLREEIAKLQKELDRATNSEKTLQASVQQLDQKVALKKKLQRQLQELLKKHRTAFKEKKIKTDDVSMRLAFAETRAQATGKQLWQLREQLKAQVVRKYKYERKPLWHRFYAARSIPAALSSVRAMAQLERVETRVMKELQTETVLYSSTRSKLEQLYQNYSSELWVAQTNLMSGEKKVKQLTREQQDLQGTIRQQSRSLESIREKKERMARDLASREASVQQIQNIIEKRLADELAKQKAAAKNQTSNPKSTIAKPTGKIGVATRGQLDWPVEGMVITRFGWQQGGAYGTTIESPGIDVKSSPGTGVGAAASGIVAQVTWLRGFGTTVIIEHESGTFTVYSHLGATLVEAGQTVKRGQIIGEVGTDGPAGGSLHFEVWSRRSKQDPLAWLERR